MRIVASIICLIITAGLVVALNTKLGGTPPLGRLLSPSHGFWKNAESANASFDISIKSGQLKDSVNVYLDERLVPHVFAQNDHDAYFVQGWLHARFRLWQMEFQTHAAAGRLSEILGEKVGNNSVLQLHDRKFRRMGMVYAAENSLKLLKETNPEGFADLEAYAAGANTYISSLQPEDYPIEYKMLDYAPEAWTPLKTALFLKYMSLDLANDDDDFEMTNLLEKVGIKSFEKMFPIQADSLSPIMPAAVIASLQLPKGAKTLPVAAQSEKLNMPVAPASLDSLYLTDTITVVDTAAVAGIAYQLHKTDPDNGSNNWVVDSTKTASGAPILCNDPHLGLNLPSLWYEIQLHTPEYNVYGVSFPGAPSVIIGFNDSIAWGVTNAMRDVMDFYEVEFKDSTLNEYWYDGKWVATSWRTETIKVRGQADYVDKLPMTIWGPVMFDGHYQSELKNGKAYAIRWKAHDAGNSFELNSFMQLNRAHNYSDYENAIRNFGCPGQNFVFASKSGDIAWWQQASFPAKWRRQGDFVMPGWDSTYRWQSEIPQSYNLHLLNPAQGFIATANQLPTADTIAYPYLGGIHDVYRGVIINRKLRQMSGITIDDMKQLQTDNYNVFAEMARPVMLKNVDPTMLTSDARPLLTKFIQWNLRADTAEEGQTIFNEWWNAFADTVWRDDITRIDSLPVPFPDKSTLLEGILRDSAFVFVDNNRTSAVETLPVMVTAALNKAAKRLKNASSLSWEKYKDTRVSHLIKPLTAFSRLHLPIGGGQGIINATKVDHGPSWRMIVQLGAQTEAWGVYPGGQNGNPGSRFYDQFVDQWADGQYYPLWVMTAAEANSGKSNWKLNFRKA